MNYLFTSERLGFRNWMASDLDSLVAMNADEVVMEHFPQVLSAAESGELMGRLIKHYNVHGYTYYAVEELSSRTFIGFIGIAYQIYDSEYTPAVDIGWRLISKAWGKGYATEGAKRCLELAFDALGINKIISTCTMNNRNSERVMQKLGMKKIGTFKHPKLSDRPDLEVCFCYTIEKKDWEAL